MRYLKQPPGFYRGVIALMIPMIIQNFVTNFMALADTFMVGTMGETYLAAVTMANTPFFILMLISFGIQSGASVLVSQYYGRGNLHAINRVLGVGLYFSIGVTLLASVLAFSFPMELMGLLTNNETLHAPGAEYARIVGFSYFFSSISGMYIAVQRSMENTKLGAVVLSGSGILNVFLNWVLIYGNLGAPTLGIAGAAIATLISRIVEVVVVLIYTRFARNLPLQPKLIFMPGREILRDFMKYSLPVVFNELLWSTAFSIYSVIMGHMDNNTPILAAYTIAGNLDRLLNVGLFAAGSAATIVIGREIGLGNRDTLYGKAVALNLVAFGIGIVSAILVLLVRFFLAESFIFPLMGLSQEACGTALYMLTFIACLLPLRAVNMTNVVGILRGGGDVRFSLIAEAGPMYLVCIPACAVTALVAKLSIVFVYPCTCLDEAVKFVLGIIRIRSKKWMNDVTREIA